jgi:23S rRNA pseudouridine2605 synthase
MVDHPQRPPARPSARSAPTPDTDPESRQETYNPEDSKPGDTAERVAKAMARAGVASRREVERLIGEGRVALNGEVLTSPAVKVAPGDLLTVDGKLVEAAEPTRLWLYHKPPGLVTSHKDPHDRPTVFQNLPKELPRVISVGRLDLASEGLLLLTNDGELSRALELPTSGWVRRYRVRAYGHTSQGKLDKLLDGITVDGVVYGSIEAKLDKVKVTVEGEKAAANLWITVGITEGKNREVRRVLEAIGLKVNRLIRLAYGPFALGTLPVGAVEEVGPRVIREQLVGLVAPGSMPQGDRRTTTILSAAPARRNPTMARAARTAPSGAVRAAVVREVEAPKKEHKPGWAKAKKRSNTHAPPKTKDRRDGRPVGDAKPRSEARPRGVQIEAYPNSHRGKPGPKHFVPKGEDRGESGRPAGKSFGAKPFAGKPAGGKVYAGRADGPVEARAPGKGYGAAKPAGPRTDAPRPSTYRPREAPPNQIRETALTPWAERRPDPPSDGGVKPAGAASARPRKPGGAGKPAGKPFGGKPSGGGKPRGARPPKGR